MTVVSDNIRYYAKQRHISLQDLAIKAGLSKNVIYQYGKGVDPSLKTLTKIANVLNVQIEDLTKDPDSNDSDDNKYIDLSGTNIFTYQGMPIPEDDWDIIKQLLDRAANRGKNDDSGDK